MKKLICIMFGLMLLSISFAEENATNILNLRYNLIACTVNSALSLIDYGKSTTNVSSNGLEDNLETGLSTLKTYANKGDKQGFAEFLRGTLKENLKNATTYLRSLRAQWIQSGKAIETREYFNTVKSTRVACVHNAKSVLMNAQIERIHSRIDKLKNITDRLSNKSVDTSGMKEILGEAQTNLDRMKEAAETENATIISKTIEELRGQHLHIWARFHAEKISAILKSVEHSAIENGYQGDVDSIKSRLDDIAEATQVGVKYTPDVFEQVKNDLKESANLLRELIKKLKRIRE